MWAYVFLRCGRDELDSVESGEIKAETMDCFGLGTSDDDRVGNQAAAPVEGDIRCGVTIVVPDVDGNLQVVIAVRAVRIRHERVGHSQEEWGRGADSGL